MSELIEILHTNPIFKTLSSDAVETLAGRFKTRFLRGGEMLFSLGDPGNEMIVVQEGQIAIYMPEAGRAEVGQALRIFKRGDILGEMALIDQLPRSASARAEIDSSIASLGLSDFRELLSSNPDVAMSVMSGLSNRIRYTTDFIGEIRQWVKRLAEGEYDAIHAPTKFDDSSLSTLAADFVRMASQVRAREEKLQQEVAQLRIEIDEKKRREQFREITQSDYYVDLKEKLKAMREDNDD